MIISISPTAALLHSKEPEIRFWQVSPQACLLGQGTAKVSGKKGERQLARYCGNSGLFTLQGHAADPKTVKEAGRGLTNLFVCGRSWCQTEKVPPSCLISR